jgi:hypothetical protein
MIGEGGREGRGDEERAGVSRVRDGGEQGFRAASDGQPTVFMEWVRVELGIGLGLGIG